MQTSTTPIDGLLIIEPDVFGDERGFFMESYNRDCYKNIGIDGDFVQDNISHSQKGVLRGLHFQKPPFAQGKLVMVITGSVWDVAVDIRKDSPTFGKWFGVELTNRNKKQFWIPEGFAHGFVALEDNTTFLYKCTNLYNKEQEGSIRWNDPTIGIRWPLENPILSQKDTQAPYFKA